MRSSLHASDKVIEFHSTEAYSILGVTKVQYSVSRPCSNEKDKITVRINPKSEQSDRKCYKPVGENEALFL
jgi:hypothetical protein